MKSATDLLSLTSLFPWLCGVAGMGGAYLAAARGFRSSNQEIIKTNQEVLKQSAEGWQGLTEVKSQELEEMLERLKATEAQIATLTRNYKKSTALNNALRRENARLQKESAELRAELAELKTEALALRARVTELEKEKHPEQTGDGGEREGDGTEIHTEPNH